MNKIINIKSKKAISEIKAFKDKRYSMIDIRFKNANLRRINALLSFELFYKNDLFINSVTLWELMQPIGSSGSHNYHELQPTDIFNAISTIDDPYCVLKVKNNRYAVISIRVDNINYPLMIIIEIGSGLTINPKANVNKIVTIYPKDDIDNYLSKISKKDVLFIKK